MPRCASQEISHGTKDYRLGDERSERKQGESPHSKLDIHLLPDERQTVKPRCP